MESDSVLQKTLKSGNGESQKREEEKPKVVVILGPTGAGKSKLSIDLASHFPVEIINADSMQVYRGLDVLTNKVPLQDQNAVPHHLLGTISPSVEFTAKDFRDSAIPIIDDILSRDHIPVIVGGTNYYIQALVSPFLLDDSAEDIDEKYYSELPGDEEADSENDLGRESLNHGHDILKELDPAAANRIHPNNHRKINQYLSLYSRSGILPSKLYQGKTVEHWGRVENSRFNCCFICVDASTTVLDRHVEQRVDSMIDSGLLHEVYEIYKVNADYTRGLRQAIGVREFEDFLKEYFSMVRNDVMRENKDDKTLKEQMSAVVNYHSNNELRMLLEGAIDKVKMNTRRLVRCQKRRLNRLQALFGWNIHYVDVTESISSKSDELWVAQVVGPAVETIRTFLSEVERSTCELEGLKNTPMKLLERDLWTQYVCKACGDRVLRGGHEWEQHKQGRRHRKRVSHLKKSRDFRLVEQQQQQ